MKRTLLRKIVMQVVVLALAIGALTILPAVAQDPAPPQGQAEPQRGPGGRGGERQLEFLTKKLNLTPDQVTQVKAIEDDARKQSMAVRDDASIAGPDKRTKMRDIHKASQDKIRALLTDDQKTKFDELQAEMRDRMQNGRGGHGAPAASPTAQP